MFTVYNSTTGRVRRAGFSNADQALQPGEAILMGVKASKGQIVDLTGEPTLRDMTEEELAEPEAP